MEQAEAAAARSLLGEEKRHPGDTEGTPARTQKSMLLLRSRLWKSNMSARSGHLPLHPTQPGSRSLDRKSLLKTKQGVQLPRQERGAGMAVLTHGPTRGPRCMGEPPAILLPLPQFPALL